MPRYYADYSSKTDRQLRHAQQGLHLGEPPSLPTGSQSAQYYNMTNDKGVKETYFEDLLRLERTATISYKEHATAADPSAEHNADGGELPSKRLSFFFRKSIEGEEIRTPRHSTHYGHSDGMEVYLTIQGRRRRGLIIDPGAANGLVGSETLRDLLQHCDLSEQVKSSITWAEKQSEVTGISGSADTTLGEVCLRLPMLKGLRDACYVADVVGGEASCCPALVGNPALVKMGAIIASSWFENKDGLLIVPGEGDAGESMQLLRLLYTDSRHYMLPLDEVTNAQDEKHRAQTFLATVHSKSSETWKDVRGTWFFTRTQDMPEPKRSHLVEEQLPQMPSDPIVTESFPVLPQMPSDPVTESVPVLPHGPLKTVRFQTVEKAMPTSVITEDDMQSARIEAEFNMPTVYPGDHYPDGLPAGQPKKLDSHYSHLKEEFYSKSGKMPVTPRNYDRWCRTKSSRAPVHLWELFSGSSRLSYLALLAGLTVAFPVDFRYGWNLGCAAHQNMILNAQDRLNPEVIVMSPSFPMSTRPPSKKSSEQEDQVEFEMKAMHFVRLWQADKLRRDALSDKLYVETLHLGNFAERYLRMPSTTTN